MASIGGLSSTTSSSIGSTSLRGYGGLASGLDRDTLIENMTYGTTSKITQQQQKKQQLEWKQAAVQSITDKMIAFGNKYTTTLTSSTNLFNSNFWGRNKITTTGENSKYVALSGTASSANALTIAAVKQLAQKATLSSSDHVSSQEIESGKIDIDKKYTTENLVGKTITFSEGKNLYSLTLDATDKDGNALSYATKEDVVESINKLLAEQTTGEDGSGKTLDQIIKAEIMGGEIGFTGVSANAVGLEGGSALNFMNFNTTKSIDITKKTAMSSGFTDNRIQLQETKDFSQMLDGKTLTFNYNGTSKTIKLKASSNLGELEKNLQEELNTAFGKGRVTVSTADGKLSFKTTTPSGQDDTSSSLTLTGGSNGLLGEDGVLKIASGSSNRINVNAKIEESGLDLSKLKTAINDKGEKTYTLYVDNGKLNTTSGTAITVTANDTVSTLMNKIGKAANMTVGYQSAADKFTFTSNEEGASGRIEMDADVAAMFGMAVTDGSAVAEGQDAIVSVKYAGSDAVIDLRRGSNTFTVDGLTVAVKGTFGYDEATGEIDPEAAVGIEATVDTDKIVDNIKSMIDEYNAIVAEVNSQLSTKHDKDYAPLTSEQRKELSESEIKNYEDKAKEGLLFGDSDLRMLSSSLRTVMSGGLIEEFKKIGITTSSSYSDNGKLELDETKLRSALATDPENVEKLFTSTAGTNADGTATYNGLATNLKSVIHQYSNPLGSSESKGVLVRKAGTSHSVMSLTDNEIYDQLQQINKMISSLQDRLQTERDRYISQFTSLETLISQMNSQSGWLSSFS